MIRTSTEMLGTRIQPFQQWAELKSYMRRQIYSTNTYNLNIAKKQEHELDTLINL